MPETHYAEQPQGPSHCPGNHGSLHRRAGHAIDYHLLSGASEALHPRRKAGCAAQPPLLAFAVPVFRANNRGYIWMAFVVIFYFTQAVVSAWLSEGAPGPVILTILTFLLFTAAMIHLKVNRPVTN